MREALRKEESIVPKDAFFEANRDQKKDQNYLHKSSFGISETACCLQAKEWFFRCFLRPCSWGTFCCFIPWHLSRLCL